MYRHRPERRGRAWALIALPALCLAVALAALWWAGGVSGPDPSASGAAAEQFVEQELEALSEELDAADLDEELSPELTALIEQAGDAVDEAVTSSAAAFLTDLDAGGASGSQGTAVRWTEERDLVGPMQDVLGAYALLSDARLMSSGYLDISGNVWAAIVQGGQEWVDMVYATCDEARGQTDVSIVRLRAEVPDQ